MKRRGWTVSWLGTHRGMENRLVPPAGIPLDTISFSGLRGKGAKGARLGGFKLLKALLGAPASCDPRRPPPCWAWAVMSASLVA
jgi:UDP-N-acetylglucosamine:LPS N-acetylglucosamine transferase